MNSSRSLALVAAVLVFVGAVVVVAKFLANEQGSGVSSLAPRTSSKSSDPSGGSTRLETSVERASFAQGERVITAVVSEVPAVGVAATEVKPPAVPAPSLVELEQKSKTLSDDLEARSFPVLFARFERGIGERIEGRSYTSRKGDNRDIYAVHMAPNSTECFRTVLPREEFPELYVIKDEILELRARISKLEYETALVKHKNK